MHGAGCFYFYVLIEEYPLTAPTPPSSCRSSRSPESEGCPLPVTQGSPTHPRHRTQGGGGQLPAPRRPREPAPLPPKPPRLSSTQIWEANWTIKLSSEEMRSLETAGIYKREIFAFKTFKLYMAGQAKPRGRVNGREVLGPWGAEAGGWGERQHRLLGVHGGPEAGSFEFLCHRHPPTPRPSSCKSLATDNTGLGGLATGQAQPLLAPNPSGSPGLPWASRGLSRPSTWGVHTFAGGLARVRPTSQPPGQSLRPRSSSYPFPGRWQSPRGGKWPLRPGFRPRGSLQEAPALPQAACAPPNVQLWEHPDPSCARSPWAAPPHCPDGEVGAHGGWQGPSASTLPSGVGVVGRRFHFPAGLLPIFHT